MFHVVFLPFPRLTRSEVVRHALLAPFDVNGHLHSVSVNSIDHDLFQNWMRLLPALQFLDQQSKKAAPVIRTTFQFFQISLLTRPRFLFLPDPASAPRSMFQDLQTIVNLTNRYHDGASFDHLRIVKMPPSLTAPRPCLSSSGGPSSSRNTFPPW